MKRKETYLSRDFRETAAQRFPAQAKQLNDAFDIGTRIVSVNIPWRLSQNLIGAGANEKTTSSAQIPLTKSICLHRKA